MGNTIDVTVIGGGMITHDLLLPSLYHLQRAGTIGEISVCATNRARIAELRDDAEIAAAFPGQGFTAYPGEHAAADQRYPDLYKEVIAAMRPHQAVVIATPDHLHYAMVKEALLHDQHVLCVKPFVLQHAQAVELGQLAAERGLFIGIEYHKRFDRRVLLARRHYRQGDFGAFVMGEAKLIEPYYYRHSNFQRWFTPENSDPFVYVGCHYVDMVYFITGLKPVEVSVVGVTGRFPNGNDGIMWAHGRVRYENGAVLSVINGLGYPDDGAGSNDQCLSLFCEGPDCGGILKHDDQFRGVSHGYVNGTGARFRYVNPDFFRLVPWEGDGYKPVGYGFDSVAANIGTIARIEQAAAGLPVEAAGARRQTLLHEIDENGIIATPRNSAVNELLVEAARLSLAHDGDAARMIYGDHPRVELGHAPGAWAVAR